MARVLWLVFLSPLWSYLAQAQTQASCTFKLFPLTIKTQNLGPLHLYPAGINDFGTIVGHIINGPPNPGVIRWAGGGVTLVPGTSLVARNDHGTSLGYGATGPILVSGTTITPVPLNVPNGGILVNGMNIWDTIVGQYSTLDHSRLHGFKRWSDGTVHTLDFPGVPPTPAGTEPVAVNDNGTVVGSYVAPGLTHGFIFHEGQWATLDYPNAIATSLVGISNAGKIIGNAQINGVTKAFLYENGAFKVISAPNAPPNSTSLRSMSPRQGLILGVIGISTSFTGFVAKCQ